MIRKKIIIENNCKDCPWYEWKTQDSKIGFCDPYPYKKYKKKMPKNCDNHIIIKDGIPKWCPLADEEIDVATVLEMQDKIESFRKFKKGWDSYDGEPISDKIIDEAKRLVPFLINIYDWVSPCGNGEILFENKDIGLSINIG